MMFEKELNKDLMNRITSAEHDGQRWFNYVEEKDMFKQIKFSVQDVSGGSVHYSEWINADKYARLTAIVKTDNAHEFDIEFHASPDGVVYGGWMHSSSSANSMTIAHDGKIFLNKFQFVIKNKDTNTHSYDVFIRLYKL